MRIRVSLVLLGIGIPILASLLDTQTAHFSPKIIQTAVAEEATAVSHAGAADPFAPSTAITDALVEEILAMKARGEDAQIAEIYAHSEQSGRLPGNPLDQGGETIATATPIPNLPFNSVGTTAGYLNNYDSACPAGTAPDVVYRYTPPGPQQVAVELCGSSYDTKLFIFENSPSTVVGCNDDACGLHSRVSILMNPGNVYFIVVDGFSSFSGSYVMSVHEDVPCVVSCPPHAVHECVQESLSPNHGKKDCNGGCNNLTDASVNLDRFDGICAGVPVCGSCFTYVNEDGANVRDTDWFLFDVAQPASVQFNVTAEFSVQLGIVNLNNCVGATFAATTTTAPCVPGLVVANLSPGRYAAFVAPSGFTGIPVPQAYVAEIMYPTQPSPCACPLGEVEPNDDLARATPIPGPGLTLCGAISCPMDGDYYVFQVPFPSALRVHLRGNAAVGSCPGGQGLHPYCEILSEDGREIALSGDITNQATWFDSDFKFGPYRYYFHVGGAGYTTGPYEIEIEMIQLSLVSCNPITVTIQAENNGARLRWFGGILPSDMVRIEYRTDTNQPFQTLAEVPAMPANFFDPGSLPFDFREYQLRVLGGREPELSHPWVGSNLGLGRSTGPNGEYDDTGDFQIQQIEWGVGPDNVAAPLLLTAMGVGGSTGDILVQDRRSMYQSGWQPIQSFAGHWMQIAERKTMIDHVAFGRDLQTGDIGVIDGRGWNETLDTLMFMGDVHAFLQPNNGGISVLSNLWLWWWWWDDFFCPGTCCRLKSIAFCTSTGAAAPAGCSSPPLGRCPSNPDCWLGCPCPPAPPPPDPANCSGPTLPPLPPTYAFGCDGCTLVPFTEFGFTRIFCQCPSEASPPTMGLCFYMIFVKCKTYCPCPDLFNICGCALPVCPGPAVWTVVPFVGPAMRAACRTDCVLGGAGC